MSGLLTYVIIGFIIYVCVYAIVERICKCKEQCEAFKAYGTYFASMGKTSEDFKVDMDAILNILKKSMEDKKC